MEAVRSATPTAPEKLRWRAPAVRRASPRLVRQLRRARDAEDEGQTERASTAIAASIATTGGSILRLAANQRPSTAANPMPIHEASVASSAQAKATNHPGGCSRRRRCATAADMASSGPRSTTRRPYTQKKPVATISPTASSVGTQRTPKARMSAADPAIARSPRR